MRRTTSRQAPHIEMYALCTSMEWVHSPLDSSLDLASTQSHGHPVEVETTHTSPPMDMNDGTLLQQHYPMLRNVRTMSTRHNKHMHSAHNLSFNICSSTVVDSPCRVGADGVFRSPHLTSPSIIHPGLT
ncbi:hypothetical protein JMJ77_0008120 [Colletotrichum scovillei]|uniref:Uncharacterized protein n=1 Tax=Colletotrichum scovillei TaxID=1209932 RepID=A0A9P7RDK1_9PEZI|nr:hypothetical protein JMJ77_0008120 [Colletotrichum scovillei]KAG7075145.1 hypothetical protein JMJ76_0011607 [Colletotrichum scovillei]KAG7082146.1 hypothetical protein JMJ78_0004251 [Colletotrichum scovillei]